MESGCDSLRAGSKSLCDFLTWLITLPFCSLSNPTITPACVAGRIRPWGVSHKVTDLGTFSSVPVHHYAKWEQCEKVLRVSVLYCDGWSKEDTLNADSGRLRGVNSVTATSRASIAKSSGCLFSGELDWLLLASLPFTLSFCSVCFLFAPSSRWFVPYGEPCSISPSPPYSFFSFRPLFFYLFIHFFYWFLKIIFPAFWFFKERFLCVALAAWNSFCRPGLPGAQRSPYPC